MGVRIPDYFNQGNRMGFFGHLKTRWRMSQGAVVVEKLLEIQQNDFLVDLDPMRTANHLVQLAWTQLPDVFEGRFGQYPHKMTTAAVALANGIESKHPGDNLRLVYASALHALLTDYKINGDLYPLNSMDHRLIENAQKVFDRVNDEVDNWHL
jgi:uncharacterized protein with von Willebrand factor type A (vWA) domain